MQKKLAVMNFIKNEVVFLIILVISIFAIYSKCIFFDFVNYDDDALIVDNITFISDIKNVPKFFMTSCFYSSDCPYYRPILTLSFSIEAMLFGTNPEIYHLTNIILFILSIYLMYIFLSKLKLNKQVLKFVCLIVAVHPIFTSTVAWIPARNDTLLTIFLMLSLINLINYISDNSKLSLFWYGLFVALSLFTKETALILIPVSILFIYIINHKFTKKQILNNMIILLLIVVIYFILRKFAVPSIPVKEYLTNWQEYMMNIVNGTATYIYLFIVPEYIPMMLYKIKLSVAAIITNLSLLSLLTILYYKKFIDTKGLLFGLAWFILALLPTFFQPEYAFLAHRLIIASLGIIIVLTLIIDKVIKMYPISTKYLVGLFMILFTSFSYASYLQANKYKDSDIFIINAYVDAPNYNLVCHELARKYIKYRNFQKAQELLNKAISISPRPEYFVDLVMVTLLIDHDLDKAEASYLKLVPLMDKQNPLCYSDLSVICYIKKDFTKAMECANKVLEIQPNNTKILKQIRRIQEASSTQTKP